MTLLVDAGNSRIKWAWAGDEPWVPEALSLEGDWLPRLEDAWCGRAAPQAVWLCSVRSRAFVSTLASLVSRLWGLEVSAVASSVSAGGVRNGYRFPERLGADRWAALVAARDRCPGAVSVADCGSAVTIDALAADGEFLGGVILPGLAMQQASLLAGTDGVRAVAGRSEPCLGRDTGEAVGTGTLYCLAGAIERIVCEQRRALGAHAALVLTGGDAPRLAPLLGMASQVVPDLVLLGVRRLAALEGHRVERCSPGSGSP